MRLHTWGGFLGCTWAPAIWLKSSETASFVTPPSTDKAEPQVYKVEWDCKGGAGFIRGPTTWAFFTRLKMSKESALTSAVQIRTSWHGIFEYLRSPGIDSARLHRLAKSIPCNRFLGSLDVYNLFFSGLMLALRQGTFICRQNWSKHYW
jgi:hypothetical protein